MMAAFAPRSMAAITEARTREENVLKVLRGRGYRDVELVRVELLGEDMIEACFTTPVVTKDGVQRREARRAFIARAGDVTIIDNWDVEL